MNAAAEEISESTEDEMKFARLQGWTDQDDYKGENGSWKSAKEFLEYGRNHNRILKQNNDKLLSQVSDLQKTMGELVADTQSQKDKAVEKAIKNLKAERAEAINDSDGEKVNLIDDQIDELKQAPPPPPPPPPPAKQTNVVFEGWLQNNAWYKNDPDLAIEADYMAQNYINSNQGLAPEKVYEAVTQRIKREFPHKFENPNKQEPGQVAQGTHSPTTKGKGFNDLPPDAKAACNKFIKSIPGFTKEKYLETYEWD